MQEDTDDKLLTKVTAEPMKTGALLDPVFSYCVGQCPLSTQRCLFRMLEVGTNI